MARGFIPGREVELLRQAFGMYVTRVSRDTQVVMDKTAADSIIVKCTEINICEKKTIFLLELESY